MANRTSVATALAGAAIASVMVVSGANAMPEYGNSGGGGYQDPRGEAPTSSLSGPYPSPEGYEYLRSLDTRDNAPAVESQPVVDAGSEPSGFDLVSAAIGAAAAAGLLLVVMATLGTRRPTGRRAASA